MRANAGESSEKDVLYCVGQSRVIRSLGVAGRKIWRASISPSSQILALGLHQMSQNEDNGCLTDLGIRSI